MRATIFLVALLVAGSVGADSFTRSGTTTARLGSKVISAGDTTKKVLDAGGNPASATNITNAYGTKIGERWIYVLGGGRNTVIEFDNNGTVVGLTNVTGQ